MTAHPCVTRCWRVGAPVTLDNKGRCPECGRPTPTAKRYFKVDAGATYTVVAADPSDAWRLFGAHIAVVEGGEDLLAHGVVMHELSSDSAASKMVHDENGPAGDRRYPLTEAELGAVFCSEY